MANVIDTFLELVEDPAGMFVLEVGRPPRIVVGETQSDAQPMAMTRQDVLELLVPVVPAEARGRLRSDPIVTFGYISGAGQAYDVEIRRDGSSMVVRFVRAAGTAPTGGPAPGEDVSADGAPPGDPGAHGVPLADRAVAERTSTPPPVAGAGHAIDALFRAMCERGASDLHLSVSVPPMVRVDGRMARLDDAAAALTRDSIERLVGEIVPEVNREEYDRRHDTDFAYEITGLARFRANVFADRKGMGAVFRAIPAEILTADQLHLSPHILQLCTLSKGLVVVTGPTGSGKSTTLCAMIDHINKTRDDHIITIEDPVEFVHENQRCLINQREIGSHTDSFRDALRAALREDPDIILVGEMRDLETIAIAIETAETGHLVFGTLHTTTAASTVDRIIDQFPPDQQSQIRVMLSESLRGVIAQNLCRKVGGGRVAALEVLIPNSAISNLIREGKTFQIPSMMQVGKASGMVLLNDALIELVKSKTVDPEEAYQKAVDKDGLVTMLTRANIDTSFAATG